MNSERDKRPTPIETAPIDHSGNLEGPMREKPMTGGVPIQAGIEAPDDVRSGFNNLTPNEVEKAAWDTASQAVRDSHNIPEDNTGQIQAGADIGAEYLGDSDQATDNTHDIIDVRLEKADKKSTRGKIATIAIATASLLTAGAAIIGANAGATGNGFIQKPTAPFPDVNPTASAPLVPGEKGPVSPQQPEVTSQPTPSVEVETPIDTKDLKFYSENGGEFQTFEQISKSAELSLDDYPDKARVFQAFIERIEDVANYFPSAKTVSESLNKPVDQLTMDDYLEVGDMYRKAHDVMFQNTSGPLYDTLTLLIKQSIYNKFESLNASDPVLYEVTVDATPGNTGVSIRDNSVFVDSVGDNLSPQLGDYQLVAQNGNEIIATNNNWQVSGSIGMIQKSLPK